MAKLTARQQQVMDVIKGSIDATGMPPTRADIARTLGFKSANAAEEHLKALAKKGVIELVAGASRGIRLTEQNGIPIVGRVAAGAPLLAQEHIEDYCDLSSSFFSPPAHYFLQVCGDSMIDAGIFDGDLLAVHVKTTARAAYLAHHLGLGDAVRFLKGGILPARAHVLLRAQVGAADAEKRIAQAGDPTRAHQQWLLAYIDRRIQPANFAI